MYSTVFIIKDSPEKGWMKVIAPYNKSFIENLKLDIDYIFRKWDQDNKMWIISEVVYDELLVILKKYFYNIKVKMMAPDDIFSYLFDLIPIEYHSKIYKSLATALHPDHGGSNEVMKILNNEFYKRTIK